MSESAAGVPFRLGHVALRVRDMQQSIDFYTKVVGLKLWSHVEGRPAFLGLRREMGPDVKDKTHDIALMPLPPGAEGPDSKRAGMYHIAWEMESFEALRQMHERLLANNVRIAGYAEAPDSTNVMFFDPDGNELEAIWELSSTEMTELKAAGSGVPRLHK